MSELILETLVSLLPYGAYGGERGFYPECSKPATSGMLLISLEERDFIEMKFAVLDFETTGNQSADEIIQVGLAIIEEDRSISRVYGTYVNPGFRSLLLLPV